MNYLVRVALTGWLAAFSLGAQALGRLAEISLVDRETGSVLATHYFKGDYWVAGKPGARYAIVIRNRLAERLLAVAAVDGVNVISGDTAAWDQVGYVFAAGQGYEIAGWRKSDAEIAAFEFTAAPDAYATRTGRPANLGVIGVALFRERLATRLESQAESPAPPTAGRAADNALGSLAGAASALGSLAGIDEPMAKLGTGHGRREHSEVASTDFERLQEHPDEIIRIRYDSRENLLALGVIPRAHSAWPRPNPFPESPLARYVPDPPGYR